MARISNSRRPVLRSCLGNISTEAVTRHSIQTNCGTGVEQARGNRLAADLPGLLSSHLPTLMQETGAQREKQGRQPCPQTQLHCKGSQQRRLEVGRYLPLRLGGWDWALRAEQQGEG
jgi:hypothetical protein